MKTELEKKYEELVKEYKRLINLSASKQFFDIPYVRSLESELSALKEQEVEGVQPKVRNILQDFRRRNDYPLTKAVPDMLNLLSKLGKQPEYEPQSAKEFVNNKLGDKNYTHSPFTIYREEMAKWLEQYHNNKQL